MKAFYIPAGLLIAILLEQTEQSAAREDWESAESQLTAAYADWDSSQTFFHTIMDHGELDEAEKLFAGAFAVCREEDGADFHQMLAQLTSQLRLLAETQSVSIKNVF